MVVVLFCFLQGYCNSVGWEGGESKEGHGVSLGGGEGCEEGGI